MGPREEKCSYQNTYQDITYTTKNRSCQPRNPYIINVSHIFRQTCVEHVFVSLLASKHFAFK